MKFSDLSSPARSMLAALCASAPGLDTSMLGRCASPKLQPERAAAVLLELRKKGLVYSHQKLVNQSYALWRVSAFGFAVFQGRPNDVQPADVAELNHNVSPVAPANPAPKATAYAVVPDTGFPVGTYDDALECAKAAAIGMGKPYVVVALVAEILPPVAPQPVVNVL